MIWKYNNGTTKNITDLTNEELNECIQTINKRQLHVILKLRKSRELEAALKKEAKSRNVTLVSLDIAENPNYSEDFINNKELIDTVSRSFALKENKIKRRN